MDKFRNSGEVEFSRAEMNILLSLKKRPRDPSLAEGRSGTVTAVVVWAVVFPRDEVVLAAGEVAVAAEWKEPVGSKNQRITIVKVIHCLKFPFN